MVFCHIAVAKALSYLRIKNRTIPGTRGRFCCLLIPNPINHPPGQEVQPSCPTFICPTPEKHLPPGGRCPEGADEERRQLKDFKRSVSAYKSIVFSPHSSSGSFHSPASPREKLFVPFLCHCEPVGKLAWESQSTAYYMRLPRPLRGSQ